MSEVDKGTDPNGTRRGRQSFTPPRDVVLNHFSHRHPLLRLHLRESEGIRCTFCNISISGWAYACAREIHRGYDHTLILRPFHLATNNEKFHCAACGDDDSVHSLFQSYYGCESCNFNLHVECASIPIALSCNVNYLLLTLICSICAKTVPNSGCWLFYNHEHDYLCYFNCVAVSEYRMESHYMCKLQNRLQNLAITNRPPSTLAGQPSGNGTHFSHHHALKEYTRTCP
ncbi:hypothetical protein R3W88_028329 [Solanum pinnatisectum]|uniref:Phorbol-ester/DAG-type domain-containing protein n=1 Tax=Solanum pinnatisectum TaxID=50273 RepID=A0AAV9LL64_9SOLN|nr:hypothetical protein R3W88_028329 [Solanum pinnatisectum]